jgi:tetratricopeptide (TPR) repeat protein
MDQRDNDTAGTNFEEDASLPGIDNVSAKSPTVKKSRPPKAEKKLFEIDYVGTGTFQVSQQNLLHQRSIEPFKNSDAILSARGLHHRSKDVFVKEVQNASSLISSLMRREKVSSSKYKPSAQLLTPYFQRALAYERLRQIDKAIEDYTLCLRIDDRCASAYFNRSGLYKVKGDIQAAIADMNKAISIEPANTAYREQRSLLFRLNGTYVEAVKETMLSRALRRQPGIIDKIDPDDSGPLNIDSDLVYASKLLDDPIVSVLHLEPEQRKDSLLEPIIDFLKGLKVFADFSSRAGLLRVARNIQMVSFASKKFIFREGEPGHHFYIVLDGEISIVKAKKHRDDDIEDTYDVVWKCYRGQSFGETALESAGGLRTAGAMATQNSKLMVLHADEFRAILHSFKSVLKEEVRLQLRSTMLFEGQRSTWVLFVLCVTCRIWYSICNIRVHEAQ